MLSGSSAISCDLTRSHREDARGAQFSFGGLNGNGNGRCARELGAPCPRVEDFALLTAGCELVRSRSSRGGGVLGKMTAGLPTVALAGR